MLKAILIVILVLSAGAGCASVRGLRGGALVGNHAKWEAGEGGVLRGCVQCERADRALNRIAKGLPRERLSIAVLDLDAPTAFSFPDGSIYVARGLVEDLTDDELAATVAHEIGHLLHDGVVAVPAALRGAVRMRCDIERAADVLGRWLLITHGIPAEALPSALEKVAARSKGTAYVVPLEERIVYLRRSAGGA